MLVCISFILVWMTQVPACIDGNLRAIPTQQNRTLIKRAAIISLFEESHPHTHTVHQNYAAGITTQLGLHNAEPQPASKCGTKIQMAAHFRPSVFPLSSLDDSQPLVLNADTDLPLQSCRYRRWRLREDETSPVDIVVRCELDGVMQHKGETQLLSIKALNEHDARAQVSELQLPSTECLHHHPPTTSHDLPAPTWQILAGHLASAIKNCYLSLRCRCLPWFYLVIS